MQIAPIKPNICNLWRRNGNKLIIWEDQVVIRGRSRTSSNLRNFMQFFMEIIMLELFHS